MRELDWGFVFKSMPTIFRDGFASTMKLTIVAFICACIIGLLLALVKTYKVPVLSQIAAVYVSFFRGTPLMVQILVFYYGIPMFLNNMNYKYGWNLNVNEVPAINFMYLVFSMCYGAYISEVMRSALLSVNKGQMEAGYTVGMNTFMVLRRIVLPQALVVALPNLGNYFVDLVKNTSLAFSATVVELLAAAKILGGNSYKYFEAYLSVAIIYWIICFIFELLLKAIEKRSRRHESILVICQELFEKIFR